MKRKILNSEKFSFTIIMINQILLIVFCSFALSKTQTGHEELDKISVMISQKVAIQSSKNLTEMGHTPQYIADLVKKFHVEAPTIIQEELVLIKYEMENEESSISKRSISNWLKQKRILRKAKAHARNAAIKVKNKMLRDENGLDKRNLASVTVGQLMGGAGYAAVVVIVGVLVVNLVFFFTDFINRLFRNGFWGWGFGDGFGYGYDYGYPPGPPPPGPYGPYGYY
jgi:hypothetical protein